MSAPGAAPAPAEPLYASPRTVESLDDCRFYHTMELPDFGLVEGDWDLRPTIDQYLGGYDFAGKRVLDVGAASGYLTFEIERRGAEVVSFDIGEDVDWDIVPAAGIDLAGERTRKWGGIKRVRNSYWLAHRALGSSASVHYGDVYELPDAMGPFDVAMIGTILPHLRDPFGALWSITRLVTGAVVITDGNFASDKPLMSLMPRSTSDVSGLFGWWSISTGCMSEMLQILGFERPRITRCKHLHAAAGQRVKQHTYVARRQRPPALLHPHRQ